MSKIKRYIPSKVYEKIQKLEFKNKDHLYIICDMLYRVTIFKKEDKDYSNNFIDIPKYYFRDIICDSDSLGKAITFLKDNEIIICDNIYSKDSGKALGYKFNDDLISIIISVEIDSKVLSKKIIDNKNKRNNLVNDQYKVYKDYFLTTFNIDYDKALNYLNDWYQQQLSTLSNPPLNSPCGTFLENWICIVNKYNHLFMSINAINDGYLFFRKNSTNGRIDTNLTSLKSEFKQFITKDNLTQLDICNSQPFILSLYLNSPLCRRNLNIDELEKYNNWTSDGLFYENFEKEYFKNTSNVLNRDMIKDMMFCIFYSKNTSYRKEKNIFRNIFPDISNYIEDKKNNNYNEFAIELQKIESNICIDIICNELDKKGIKYYTIHDAWLVDDKYVDQTKNIILEMFHKNFNRIPTIKVEKIKKEK